MTAIDLDWTITIGQIITFLTVIAGFVYTWNREARARRWAEEDAKKRDHAMAEQKKSTDRAFTEANSINDKIANYQQEICVLQQQLRNVAQRKTDPRVDTLTRSSDKEKP